MSSSFYLVRGTDPAGTDRIDITGETLVGRSDECDLTVHDGHPSRRHARLTVENGRLWVEDLGSANGTFVNDRQITDRTELHPGDRIAFDLAMFTVGGAAAGADADATVVRRPPVDPNATVVRPVPAAGAGESRSGDRSHSAEESRSGDRSHSAPAGDRSQGGPAGERSQGPPAANVPKSWADPDYQTAGTRVLSREELAAMAAGTPMASPGEEVDGPHLRVLVGTSAGRVLRLDGKQEWTIGSDAGRDLELHDDGISGFHAKISHDAGRWRVIDQMSANGTWVNGEKVTVSYLGNGDRLRFAQVECEVRLAAARGSRSATRAGSTRRPWVIAVAAAAATAAVLALVSWLV
ncbi:MAG TPA: FHA domain-containing protein [Pseudomonadales bacterium]